MMSNANNPDSSNQTSISSNPYTIIGLILFALAAVLLVYLQYRFKNHTWDDSYITFRHSLNMARGYGLVYNPGEKVDGITNYLLAWTLGNGIRLGIDPQVFARWIGMISSWILIFWIWTFARVRLNMSPVFAGLSTLFLASFGKFAMESMGGLETNLFTLFIFWILWEITESPGKELSNRRLILAGFASGLALLTRPDAALYVIVVIPFLIDCSNLKASLRRVCIFVIPLLAIFLPYFISHWISYGYPFPNSYYAKKLGSSHLLSKGFTRLYLDLKDIGFILFIFFLIALYAVKKRKFKFENNFTTHVILAIALFFLVRCVFIVASGGPWIGWGRFIVPAIPFFCLLYAASLESGWKIAQKKPLMHYLVFLFATGLIFNNIYQSSEFLLYEKHWSIHLDRVHIPLGIALGDVLEPNESISFGDAGALPYYGDIINIDPAGLCDKHIAHLSGNFNYKTDPDYIISRKPVVIILNSIDPYPQFNPQSPIDKAILSSPRFLEEYSFAIAFEAWSGYNLWLFARKDKLETTKKGLINHPALSHLFGK